VLPAVERLPLLVLPHLQVQHTPEDVGGERGIVGAIGSGLQRKGRWGGGGGLRAALEAGVRAPD
jgi:hypothetical protein